jgi:hypothetical protein
MMSYSVYRVAFFALCTLLAVAQQSVNAQVMLAHSYRVAFVTEGTMMPTSADIATYDAFVTTQASNSATLTALNTNWRVIGSTVGVDAIVHTGTDSVGVPIFNTAGRLVATNYADLWDGSLINPIKFDQGGKVVTERTFTGTAPNGTAIIGQTLGDAGHRVRFGEPGSTNSNWMGYDWLGDGNSLHYYAISDVVPEPASLSLLGLVGIALLRRCR